MSCVFVLKMINLRRFAMRIRVAAGHDNNV